MDIVNEIDQVFAKEISTLSQTRDSLGPLYSKAVTILFECSRNVVVTGAGKSGLIAQKIASTMVSTGTPAIFLHPSDGMHGDVGVVRQGDVVVAISKSGETEELLNILPYVKSIGVEVISITGNPDSTLGRISTVVLHTPIKEEACSLDLAPTSSTTAALVVGDGLAVALMKMRDFQPDDFAVFHPGGQLGKRLLLTVADIMRSGEDNPVLDSKASVQEMLVQITSKRSGAVSVVDEQGMLLGLITDYDIRKVLEQGQEIFSLSPVEIMNKNSVFIYSDEKAVKAVEIMQDRDKSFLLLPVLNRESGKVVGMVHLQELVAKGL